MKLLKTTIMASLAAMMALTACTSASDGGNGGSQAIEIKDGKFTPEVLLSLGRVSDP